MSISISIIIIGLISYFLFDIQIIVFSGCIMLIISIFSAISKHKKKMKNENLISQYTDESDQFEQLKPLSFFEDEKPSISNTQNVNVDLQPYTKPEIINTKPEITNSYIGKVKATKVNIDANICDKLKKKFIAFDVETTGLSENSDRIIEIGATIFVDGIPTNTFESLVNPQMHIPESASKINHITDDMVVNAPKESEMCKAFSKFVGDAFDEKTILCAHNASFDIGFLKQALSRAGIDANIEYVDTLTESRKAVKDLANYKLQTIATHFSLSNENAHRANSDATICGEVLCNILKIKEENIEKEKQYLEKIKLSDAEIKICKYIKNIIVTNNLDTKWLGFTKTTNGIVSANYGYKFLQFKLGKKPYVIINRKYAEKHKLPHQNCAKKEGFSEDVRYHFTDTSDLDPLTDYILSEYKEKHKSLSKSSISEELKKEWFGKQNKI